MTTTCAPLFARNEHVSVFSAARITGYSRRMVRHLIETKELPAQRKGRRSWNIDRNDLFDCLKRRLRVGKLRKMKEMPHLVSREMAAPDHKCSSCSRLTDDQDSTIYSTGSQSILNHNRRQRYAQHQEPNTEVHQ